MSAEPVRRRKNRKTNTSLGIPHTFSFPLLPTHECRAVNLHMMTLKILFHMDVKWGTRKSGPHWPERRSRKLKQSISGGETPNRLLPTALTDASFFLLLFICAYPQLSTEIQKFRARI